MTPLHEKRVLNEHSRNQSTDSVQKIANRITVAIMPNINPIKAVLDPLSVRFPIHIEKRRVKKEANP